MEDTIAAISTNTVGTGAINIIRMSGSESISILSKIFSNKKILQAASHTIHYGFIKEEKKLIDEVLVMIMKAPKTYTREDIVEINCHGGAITTNKILELLLENGARLAEPGEFTKRAFLNGRINLLEAESVMDLINAKSQSSKDLALNGINGTTTKLISNLREKMVELLANIEVNIDYPEYTDELLITRKNIKPILSQIDTELQEILKNASNGKHVKNGINIALVGRPNVGKSSLLNTLLGEQKAIVTDISGTTRDIVEGSVIYKNILFNFIDTAGIRQTNDIVEQLGVEKSKTLLKEADITVLVLNNNEEWQKEDSDLLESLSSKSSVLFINKIDLNQKINLPSTKIRTIKGSTETKEGIKELEDAILDLLNLSDLDKLELSFLSNPRQIALAKQARKSIKTAIESNEQELPIDIVAIDIKEAWEKLGMIIGESYEEELVDNIFKRFCLGK